VLINRGQVISIDPTSHGSKRYQIGEHSILSVMSLPKMGNSGLITKEGVDKPKLEDGLQNNFPVIFKTSRPRNSKKGCKLFQTEGDQRDVTTGYNV